LLLLSVTSVGIVSEGSADMRNQMQPVVLLPKLSLCALFSLLRSVTSVGIVSEGSADMRKLNTWLSGLLQERGPDLFRSKGILAIHGSDDKWEM
jgi:G3E family GTPase